jgi:hypothetical protein
MLYLAVAATISSCILFVFAGKARKGYLLLLLVVLGYGLWANLPKSAVVATLLRHAPVRAELAADEVLSRTVQVIEPGMTIATNDDEILNGVFWRKGDIVHLVRLPNDTPINPKFVVRSAADLLLISQNVESGMPWAGWAAQNGFTRLDIEFAGSRGLEALRSTAARSPNHGEKQ